MVCRHKALEHQMEGALTSAGLKHCMRRRPGGYDYPGFSGCAARAVMDSRAAESRAVARVHVGAKAKLANGIGLCKNPTTHVWQPVRLFAKCGKTEMSCRLPTCKRRGKPSDFFFCSLCTDLSKHLVPMCPKCQWVFHNSDESRTPRSTRKRTRIPDETSETNETSAPNTPHTDEPRHLRRRLN